MASVEARLASLVVVWGHPGRGRQLCPVAAVYRLSIKRPRLRSDSLRSLLRSCVSLGLDLPDSLFGDTPGKRASA